MMDRTKKNEVAELTKLGLKTFLNIGQMARYRYLYTYGKELQKDFILREFVMSKVSCDEMCNMDMIVELLRPQLEKANPDDI